MTKEEAEKHHRELTDEIAKQGRDTPIEVRFRQLCELFEIAHVLDLRSSTDEEDQMVRDRWALLKRKYAESPEFRAKLNGLSK